MDYGHANLAFASTLLATAAQGRLRHVVICPGSRSTPLALAAALHPALKTYVLIDERSAAFFALGMARQLCEPVALICTSGTAAANFAPAVIEAYLSRIPLLVLTADRPAELRDWGASQTIDQVDLYGSHTRWFADLPAPVGDAMEVRFARATAARAMNQAAGAPAGPVHLNVQFREPLFPADADPLSLLREIYEGLAGPAYSNQRSGSASAEDVQRLVTMVHSNSRAIIVCGPHHGSKMGTAVAALSTATGFPVLADPLSSVRFAWPDTPGLIDSYDLFLRDSDVASRLSPDLVLRLGGMPTSKPLMQFLGRQDAQVVAIDPGNPRDAGHAVSWQLVADEGPTIDAIAAAVRNRGEPPASDWLQSWQDVNDRTRRAIDAKVAAIAGVTEPSIASEIVAHMPAGGTLVVGNSMPVRDVDSFAAGGNRGLHVTGTRGASGIDGVISTAIGAAAVADGPVALLVGDLSFLHDLGGLQAKLYALSPLVIVVINNDGGGIFSFLPQYAQLDIDTFEKLFGTAAAVDVEGAARMFRCSYVRTTSLESFRCAISQGMKSPGVTVVEVRTDRAENLALHREIAATVLADLKQQLAA